MQRWRDVPSEVVVEGGRLEPCVLGPPGGGAAGCFPVNVNAPSRSAPSPLISSPFIVIFTFPALGLSFSVTVPSHTLLVNVHWKLSFSHVDFNRSAFLRDRNADVLRAHLIPGEQPVSGEGGGLRREKRNHESVR